MPKRMSDREWFLRQQKQREEAALNEQAIKAIRNKQIKKEKDEKDEAFIRHYDMNNKARINRESYIDFKNKLKKTLLTECIYNVYSKSIPDILLENLTNKGIDIESIERGFIEDFIEEQGGTDKLLRRWSRGNSLLLNEYVELINETMHDVINESDKNDPETYGLPTNAKSQFYSQLAQSTPDEVVETIKSRIMDSVEGFLDNQSNMKTAIMDICNNAQTKIATTDDDSLKESAQFKARVLDREVRNKPCSVFEEMARNLSKSILISDDLREQYMDENGRIDIGCVTDLTTIMYGFLETCNTMKLVNVDNEYINEILEAMVKDQEKEKSKNRIKDIRNKALNRETNTESISIST